MVHVLKLIITLRFLAGGLHEDIFWGWKINPNSFFAFVFKCILASDEEIENLVFPMRSNTPTEDNLLKELSGGELEFA
jgi:hypothetical protein